MNILVYLDEGVGRGTFSSLLQSLDAALQETSHRVHTCDRITLLTHDWESDTTLFVMPGGRDLPYHKALQGEGNARLRAFVKQGGSYLGICAGGYYGAASIEFEKGGPLEVCGKRELAFFPGRAVGPAYGCGFFNYGSGVGSCAAPIEWQNEEIVPLYYNGGCFFVDIPPEVTILGRYADLPGKPAAIVHCPFECGSALLCGLHPECSASAFGEGDPHLKQLLPDLHASEKKRARLWKKMIEILT